MKYSKQIKISLLLAALLGFSACGGGGSSVSDTPESEILDDNATTPDNNTSTPDDNATVSSEGINIATTNEVTKSIYSLMGSPLLLDSKVYMRFYRGFDAGVDVGMKVVSYDLSQFNMDMNLSDLPTTTLYEQVGPNYTTERINQRYYDIAEFDNQLYFATLPESIDSLSQSSIIKYDLASQTELYHVKRDPVLGENLNTTFDLAKGWFIPFNSNSYMGIVENSKVGVVNANDGESYKYGVYDYFGGGLASASVPPVATDSGFFSTGGSYVEPYLYNVSFLSDFTSYGNRDIGNDTAHITNNILTDFKSIYAGTKNYLGVGQVASLVLDGDNIYALTSIGYDDADGFTHYDLYLLTYTTDSTLKSAVYLDGSNAPGTFDVWETYKYNDSIYFKFRHDQKNELCAYSLTTNSFTFRHEIENNYYFTDIPETSYIITGDTIIMPENIAREEENCSDNPLGYRCYDLVFKVLDMSDGALLKTVRHNDLDSLKDDGDDVRVRASLSDADAVYFFAERTTKSAKNSMIIKLDTPSNSVQKTRNRFDNHLTGVITDSN